MNVYVETPMSYQKHCVVAKDMETAVKLWKKKYKYEPKGLELYSKYVIVEASDDPE